MKQNSKHRTEELRADIRKGMVDGRVRQDYIRWKEKELVVALKEEELYWKMKSQNTWGLEDNIGVWRKEFVSMQEIVVDYFTTLFQSGGSWNGGEVATCMGGKVDGRQNEELIRPFFVDEIREAVFQISATKSPGPDGRWWVIAKLMMRRPKYVMDRVISCNQSAFVLGRQIHDNILVVHEILHSLKQGVEGEEGWMAIKLDMAKAYD
ncbi:hypothetical protein EV1_043031 [Malus domestica]